MKGSRLWDRTDLAGAFGAEMWKAIGGVGGEPYDMTRAGDELVTLYEQANGKRLGKIMEQLVGVEIDEDDDVPDVPLIFSRAAMGRATAEDRALLSGRGVVVPTFDVRRVGHAKAEWQGSPDPRPLSNPTGPGADAELEGYILQGMARAIWVQAFILWATEIDLHVDKESWEEEAGETPPGALEAARDLATGIQKMNARSVAAMFLATRGHVRLRHSETHATEADRSFAFGGDLALACLGTLDVPEFSQFNLPEMKTKIALDRKQEMELSWDISGETPAENPSRWAHSDVQSLLFDKARYSVSRAQRWAQDHGFKYGSVDEGHGDFIHLRQSPHRPGQPCATVDFGHQGIKAIVCASRNPGSTSEPEMTLQRFATDVNAELPYITPEPGNGAKGRFGDRKVFIAALWRQLRTAPGFERMTLPEFKARLVRAHDQRLLELARADLVAAMDPKEVAESQWDAPDRGRSYHFVVDKSV